MASMKVSEMQQVFNEILKSVSPTLAKFFWSFMELNKNVSYYTKFYES